MSNGKIITAEGLLKNSADCKTFYPHIYSWLNEKQINISHNQKNIIPDQIAQNLPKDISKEKTTSNSSQTPQKTKENAINPKLVQTNLNSSSDSTPKISKEVTNKIEKIEKLQSLINTNDDINTKETNETLNTAADVQNDNINDNNNKKEQNETKAPNIAPGVQNINSYDVPIIKKEKNLEAQIKINAIDQDDDSDEEDITHNEFFHSGLENQNESYASSSDSGMFDITRTNSNDNDITMSIIPKFTQIIIDNEEETEEESDDEELFTFSEEETEDDDKINLLREALNAKYNLNTTNQIANTNLNEKESHSILQNDDFQNHLMEDKKEIEEKKDIIDLAKIVAKNISSDTNNSQEQHDENSISIDNNMQNTPTTQRQNTPTTQRQNTPTNQKQNIITTQKQNTTTKKKKSKNDKKKEIIIAKPEKKNLFIETKKKGILYDNELNEEILLPIDQYNGEKIQLFLPEFSSTMDYSKNLLYFCERKTKVVNIYDIKNNTNTEKKGRYVLMLNSMIYIFPRTVNDYKIADPVNRKRFFQLTEGGQLFTVFNHKKQILFDNITYFDVSSNFLLLRTNENYQLWRRVDTDTEPFYIFDNSLYNERINIDNDFVYIFIKHEKRIVKIEISKLLQLYQSKHSTTHEIIPETNYNFYETINNVNNIIKTEEVCIITDGKIITPSFDFNFDHTENVCFCYSNGIDIYIIDMFLNIVKKTPILQRVKSQITENQNKTNDLIKSTSKTISESYNLYIKERIKPLQHKIISVFSNKKEPSCLQYFKDQKYDECFSLLQYVDDKQFCDFITEENRLQFVIDHELLSDDTIYKLIPRLVNLLNSNPNAYIPIITQVLLTIKSKPCDKDKEVFLYLLKIGLQLLDDESISNKNLLSLHLLCHILVSFQNE